VTLRQRGREPVVEGPISSAPSAVTWSTAPMPLRIVEPRTGDRRQHQVRSQMVSLVISCGARRGDESRHWPGQICGQTPASLANLLAAWPETSLPSLIVLPH